MKLQRSFLTICMVFTLAYGLHLFLANPSQESTVSAQTPKPVPASVPLTHEEALEVQLNAANRQNLELQIAKVNRDIADARDKIQKESDELLNRLVKAHGIDPAKYRLDPQAQAFVPIPAPAAPKQSPAK